MDYEVQVSLQEKKKMKICGGSFEKNRAIVFEPCCDIGKKERMRLVLTGDSGGMGNFQFNRNLGLPLGRSCMYKI